MDWTRNRGSMDNDNNIDIYIGNDKISIPVDKDDTAPMIEKKINAVLYQHVDAIGPWSASCELGNIEMSSKNPHL